MKLTVLGKYGPYPPANGATSGYLLSEGSTHILLDCGSSVVSRLQRLLPLGQISAIVLSHLHSDHIADMFVLRSALQSMQKRGEADKLPMKVFLPGSPAMEYAMLCRQNVFEMINIENDMRVHLGELEMSFHTMRHPILNFGVLLYGKDKSMAYTGDTSLHDELAPFAMGVNLLLADTALLDHEKTSVMAPHLTALEVGQIAKEAGVRRLLCTHIAPHVNEDDVRREAARHFPSAEIAQEMSSYIL